jgi:hypothetical protein
VLYDGFLCGTWRLDGGTLVVQHVERLPKRALTALAAEGRHLLRFLAADTSEVRFVRA